MPTDVYTDDGEFIVPGAWTHMGIVHEPAICEACGEPLRAPFLVPICTPCGSRVIRELNQLEATRQADLRDRLGHAGTREKPEPEPDPVYDALRAKLARDKHGPAPAHPDAIA